MIRLVQPADKAAVLAAAQAAPGLGPLLWAEWLEKRENPALPFSFYHCGGAVLELNGNAALLCGPVGDAAEMEAFFALVGVQQLEATHWAPGGWAGNGSLLMEWHSPSPGRVLPGKADDCPRPPSGLDTAPAPGEITQVLQAAGAFESPAGRERYYATLCTRLNHGHALWYGLRRGGTLVAVAGATRLTGWEAYLSGVATLPGARGNGSASALVVALCRRLAGPERRITLQCSAAMARFYKKLGFLPAAAQPLSVSAPAPHGGATPNESEEPL